ncbi:MAG: universal stress protein [Caldilineales bacterium]|nr:universal stress protein [Caldilineales bacterium]
MFSKILVPLDGSPLAERALPYAISLAQKYGAEIHLLQVIATPAWSWQGEMVAESPELIEMVKQRELTRAAAYLSDQEQAIQAQGIKAAAFAVQSQLIDQAIIDVCVQEGCDAIVMSTHGLTGLSRLFLGSVAERVVRQSTAPVLLIRASRD